jgi:hypothetical protein
MLMSLAKVGCYPAIAVSLAVERPLHTRNRAFYSPFTSLGYKFLENQLIGPPNVDGRQTCQTNPKLSAVSG